MDKSPTSEQPNKPKNHKTQKGKTDVTIPLDTRQGGETVEFISRDQMVEITRTDCKHENVEIDPSETEFIAYVCKGCPMVKLFQKANE